MIATSLRTDAWGLVLSADIDYVEVIGSGELQPGATNGDGAAALFTKDAHGAGLIRSATIVYVPHATPTIEMEAISICGVSLGSVILASRCRVARDGGKSQRFASRHAVSG